MSLVTPTESTKPICFLAYTGHKYKNKIKEKKKGKGKKGASPRNPKAKQPPPTPAPRLRHILRSPHICVSLGCCSGVGTSGQLCLSIASVFGTDLPPDNMAGEAGLCQLWVSAWLLTAVVNPPSVRLVGLSRTSRRVHRAGTGTGLILTCLLCLQNAAIPSTRQNHAGYHRKTYVIKQTIAQAPLAGNPTAYHTCFH